MKIKKLQLGALIVVISSVAPGIAQTGKPQQVDPRASQTSAANTQRGAQSIKGRILGDGGRPIADASIMLFPINIGSNPQGAITSLLRPIVSDADGKFEAPSLQPGAYSISASSPGYVLSDSDEIEFYRPGDNVTLNLVKGAVITGRVTSSAGDPMVGVAVRAIRIREPGNKKPRTMPLSEITDALSMMLGPYRTDDRGIYRIYGLQGGTYQVAAGGSGDRMSVTEKLHDADAPTYYPSSTLDTASEIELKAGDEATGIDIRYRDHRGHSISGSVSGAAGSNQISISIVLTRAGTSITEATTMSPPTSKNHGFEFSNLLDGEYVATAIANITSFLEAGESPQAAMSKPQRITVRGADVTGVELTLEQMGMIAGSVTLDLAAPPSSPKDSCKPKPPTREEVVIDPRSENPSRSDDIALFPLSAFHRTTPNERGEFKISLLNQGSYHLEASLPGDDDFIKSITLPPSGPNGKPIDAALTGVRLKTGDKVNGLVMTLGLGAAGIKGRIVAGEKNNAPTEKVRLYLVPAEADAADRVLRYFEADPDPDGTFTVGHIPPGQYWLVTREVFDQDNISQRLPLSWNEGARLGLRFDGQAGKKMIELAPCQRVADLLVKHEPLIKPGKPAQRKTKSQE